MKIGMNLLLWTDKVTEQHDGVLEQIKGLGYDGVEVPVFDTTDLKPYERLGERLRSLGLGATGVTVMTPEANPIAADPAVREAAVKHLDRVLECGQAFGCETLAGPTHSAIGVFTGAGPTDEEFKAGVETLRKVGDRAKERGITLALEYLNRFECYFLNTAEAAGRFVREVDHPSVRMMYDSFHANIEEKDQGAAIRSCRDLTVHVHVSENDRGTPGTGGVNWPSFWEGLKSTGYDGYLTIEAFGQALPALAAATRVWRPLFPDAQGLCRDGLAFIKKSAGLP